MLCLHAGLMHGYMMYGELDPVCSLSTAVLSQVRTLQWVIQTAANPQPSFWSLKGPSRANPTPHKQEYLT